jgi:type IV pilus assembly protein PilX
MIMRKDMQSIPRQRGMVLVTALLLLIVVTLLAVGMFRSFGLDEKIAGNVREKQRALNAAETAEAYAEYWLSNNTAAPVSCTAGMKSNVGGQVCNNVLTTAVPNNDVTVVPWTIAGAPVATTYVYAPTAATTMNVTGAAGGAGNYYFAPGFYISLLGASTSGNGTVYQIDAVGYGGSPDTAAVIETTYSITSSGGCNSCSQ